MAIFGANADASRRGGVVAADEIASIHADIDARIALRRLVDDFETRGDGESADLIRLILSRLDRRLAIANSRLAVGLDRRRGALIPRRVVVRSRSREVRLEPAFWTALAQLARETDSSVDELCALAASEYDAGSLSSSIRVLILDRLRSAAAAGHTPDREHRNGPW